MVVAMLVVRLVRLVAARKLGGYLRWLLGC